MKYKDLTEEQKSKVANAKSPEEILEMANTVGYELTDEEIEGIAGGTSASGVGGGANANVASKAVTYGVTVALSVALSLAQRRR